MRVRDFLIGSYAIIVASCSGFDHKQVEEDFKKKCPDCKVVNIDSQECEDGSILSCYLVTINYTQNSDTVKTVACQYIKGDSGWHLAE